MLDSRQMQIVACPNPFKIDSVDMTIDVGLSISQIMEQVQPDPILRRYAHIYVNDEYVQPEQWSTTFPGEKSLVTVRVVPHGGDGKNPLATILSIALIVAAPQLGLQLAGKLGFGLVIGSMGPALGTALVGIAGALAISAIAPPPSQNMAALSNSGPDSPTLSIAGSRNQAGLYKPIPKILGKHLVTPYYGAPPYTELVGQDQYMRFLFVVGYGPLELSEFKIGETDLYSYDDVEVEIRQGFDDDAPLTLFPNTVSEAQVGIALTQAGGWVEQITLPAIDEFSVELILPRGLVQYDDQGQKNTTTVNVELEYKHVDEPTTWTKVQPVYGSAARAVKIGRAPGEKYQREENPLPYYRTDLIYVNRLTGRLGIRESSKQTGSAPAAPATPANCYPIAAVAMSGTSNNIQGLTDLRPAALTAYGAGNFLATSSAWPTVDIAAGSFDTVKLVITGKTTSAVRHGVTVPVENGQYDVRMRRTTADASDDKLFNDTTWAVLRSIENTDPIVKQGLAKIALRIRATDQLQGVIDQFNLIAQSILPAWNGSAWIEQPTSNNAALYRDVFQGPAMKTPLADSRMDLTALQSWAEECDDKGISYNAVIDYQTTPFEMAKDIAAVARAAYSMKDGLYSVVRDSQAAINAGCKQWITPRNSWDVIGEKSFDEIHALKIRFINADAGYRQDQVVVYKDGFDEANATRIDEMQLHGITDYDQAWKQGRYYLAVAELRPEMHNRMVDVEHLVCTRGDLIRVVDDVAMHGLASGRIKSLTPESGDVTAITIDETVTMEAGKTYAVRFRYAEGGDFYRAIETVEGDTNTLTPLVAIPAIDAPEAGDLIMFGETAQESSEKIVHHIEMGENLSARIYYVDAAPAVHTADSGTIPTYDPGISIPADPAQDKPAVPEILDVRSDETAAEQKDDGSFADRIMISLTPGIGGARAEQFECHYKLTGVDSSPWSVLPRISADTGVIYIPDVAKGIDYTIRLRAISSYGKESDWEIITETVAGKTGTVPSVANLWVENSTGDHLTFIEQDCHIVWTNQVDLWHDPLWLKHYLVEIKDKDTSALLHSEKVVTERFDLSLAKNQALADGPHREFKVTVTVVDIFGRTSTPVTIQPVNHQAGQVTGVSSLQTIGGVELFWNDVGETALKGYEIHLSQTDGFTPGAVSLKSTVSAGTLSAGFKLTDGIWYARIAACDLLGADNITYSAQHQFAVDAGVPAANVSNFFEEMSKLFAVPILEGDSWSTNGTNLSWNAHSLYYKGTKYSIGAGSTGNGYVYWAGLASAYSTTDVQATFDGLDRSSDQWQIAKNFGNSFELAWNAMPNAVIGTLMLGNAIVKSANIESVDADQINAGTISSVLTIIGSMLRSADSLVQLDCANKLLKMTDSATGDFVEMVPKDLRFFLDGTLYKSVRRVEVGVASHGDSVVFPTPFQTVPAVFPSWKNLQSYDASGSSYDQKINVAAENIDEYGFDLVTELTNTGYGYYTDTFNKTFGYNSYSTEQATSRNDVIKLYVNISCYVSYMYQQQEENYYANDYKDVTIQYRAVGSSTWLPLYSGPTSAASQTFTKVVTSDDYEIRACATESLVQPGGTVFVSSAAQINSVSMDTEGGTDYATGDALWIAIEGGN